MDLHSGSINVSVACFESFCYGFLLLILVLPCSKPDSGCNERGSVKKEVYEWQIEQISRISAPVLSLNLVLSLAIVRFCGSG